MSINVKYCITPNQLIALICFCVKETVDWQPPLLRDSLLKLLKAPQQTLLYKVCSTLTVLQNLTHYILLNGNHAVIATPVMKTMIVEPQ